MLTTTCLCVCMCACARAANRVRSASQDGALLGARTSSGVAFNPIKRESGAALDRLFGMRGGIVRIVCVLMHVCLAQTW
jgi:hypothetical protein